MHSRRISFQGRRAAAGAAIAMAVGGLLFLGATAAPASRLPQATHAALPATVGEHSALGDRRVDELNQALQQMGRLRGEHAGLSRAEYEAVEALGRP